MKPSVGNPPPVRLAPPKKPVQLDLRRQPARKSKRESLIEEKSSFWKWVGIVALFHVAIFIILCVVYATSPHSNPVPQFMDLLPLGESVHGTPGAQVAPHVGNTTPAPSHPHPAPHVDPAPPTPVAIQPPPPTPVPPPHQVVKPPTEHPITPPPIKPPVKPPVKPPTKPRITLSKNDLTVAEGPTTPHKHVVKKPLKPAPTETDTNTADNNTETSSDNSGLSKEQIAEKLGQAYHASGVSTSTKSGTNGSPNSHESPFAGFYLSIHDQVMEKWRQPQLSAEPAVVPDVVIHVEDDGTVPPDQVSLFQSSGNQAYDDSAIAAAKSLGRLHEPLPHGCPPNVHITFTLTR